MNLEQGLDFCLLRLSSVYSLIHADWPGVSLLRASSDSMGVCRLVHLNLVLLFPWSLVVTGSACLATEDVSRPLFHLHLGGAKWWVPAKGTEEKWWLTSKTRSEVNRQVCLLPAFLPTCLGEVGKLVGTWGPKSPDGKFYLPASQEHPLPWTECLCPTPPQFLCWNPNHQCDSIWRWGLLELIKSWGWGPHK